jgi:hypothetical protein
VEEDAALAEAWLIKKGSFCVFVYLCRDYILGLGWGEAGSDETSEEYAKRWREGGARREKERLERERETEKQTELMARREGEILKRRKEVLQHRLLEEAALDEAVRGQCCSSKYWFMNNGLFCVFVYLCRDYILQRKRKRHQMKKMERTKPVQKRHQPKKMERTKPVQFLRHQLKALTMDMDDFGFVFPRDHNALKEIEPSYKINKLFGRYFDAHAHAHAHAHAVHPHTCTRALRIAARVCACRLSPITSVCARIDHTSKQVPYTFFG